MDSVFSASHALGRIIGTRAELEQVTALSRLSTADDDAREVLFLVSEPSRNISGRDLFVDAGWKV